MIRYHRLALVEKNVGRANDGHIVSRWLCDCGASVDVMHSRVKQGATQSCGCLMRERSSEKATKHGKRKTPEYSSWIAMKRRCETATDKDYARYGGRGVTVYPEWSKDFAAFLAYIGPRPKGTTLDRIDPGAGYMPGNVRWASAKVQGRNRRGTFTWYIKGRVFGSVTEAAAAFGVTEATVCRWVKGAFDKRRNSTTLPRSDCYVERRYS